MSYWKPLILDGNPIDLSHLEPFEFEVIPKNLDASAVVRVRFNDHCFTEDFDPGKHACPLPATHVASHETRGFSEARYGHSKNLPTHIRGFDGQRISQTRTGTLVKLTLDDGSQYGIFFTLKRAGPLICDLFVVSAYPLDRPPHAVVATGEMKFNVAVALVLSGKKPKFPSGRF